MAGTGTGPGSGEIRHEARQEDTQERQRLDRLESRYTILRLGMFLLFIGGWFGLARSPLYPLLISLPAFVSFFFLIGQHHRVRRQLRLHSVREQLRMERNERRLSRRSRRQAPEISDTATGLELGELLFAPEPASFALDP